MGDQIHVVINYMVHVPWSNIPVNSTFLDLYRKGEGSFFFWLSPAPLLVPIH